ncbi:MAG TPA: pyridoxamine 5'-phosphate oxidase family protein [Acidimicrobiales bacterium]|nr:pyridoxamine 5'-phosphate oxidase family protein [Acidimicrobiales bacterium]
MRQTVVPTSGHGSSSPSDVPELEVLDEVSCLQLLCHHNLGRIAFVHESWPIILPVNYVYEEPHLIIRTGLGAKLESAPLNAAAFEVDGLDPSGDGAWSVLAQGPALDITESRDELSARLRSLPLVPMAPGEHRHTLRMTAMFISGRRFGGVDHADRDRSERAIPARRPHRSRTPVRAGRSW